VEDEVMLIRARLQPGRTLLDRDPTQLYAALDVEALVDLSPRCKEILV
jgi:hypothetical protein